MLIGIMTLFFSIRKKSVIGIIISTILIIPIVLTLLMNTIDELSISKKDIISDLKHLQIDLKDDFKIIDNTVTGMPERIQETKVEISERDKKQIVKAITNALNFKSFETKHEIIVDNEQFNTSDKISNFKYPEFYSREVYKNIDNIPTRVSLTLDESRNEIKYRILEGD